MPAPQGFTFGTTLQAEISRRALQGGDLAHANLPHMSGLGAVAEGSGIRVAFYYKNSVNRLGEARTDLVLVKQPLSDPNTEVHVTITPAVAKAMYPDQFHAFQNYDEGTDIGTPLSELPGLSQSQIARLITSGIRSVEDLLEVSDDALMQIDREAMRAKKIAENWRTLQDAGEQAVQAATLETAMLKQAEAWEREKAQMMDLIGELKATVGALRMSSGQRVSTSADAPIMVDGEGAGLTIDDDDGFMGGGPIVDGTDDLTLPGDEID